MTNTSLRLSWSQTQDYFDIEPDHNDFAKWFVEKCTEFGNIFMPLISDPSQDTLICQLQTNLDQVNNFLTKIRFPKIPPVENMYSQHSLNLLHKNWIHLVRTEPRIDKLIHKTSPELFVKFHDINLLIHKIEQRFEYRLKGDPNWKVENEFQHINPSNSVCNVYLCYTDWGKSSWHKFVNGINDPDDFELSNWKTIGSDIIINLSYPYNLTFAPDYLEYCKQHQIEPTVRTWPLGNLVSYNQNMPVARQIMETNLRLNNNHLSFDFIE